MSNSSFVRMVNALAYKPLKMLERVKGIEPSYSAWKAVAVSGAALCALVR
ncbi:hypothetical protein [Bradyrhizobium sp. LA7.1]